MTQSTQHWDDLVKQDGFTIFAGLPKNCTGTQLLEQVNTDENMRTKVLVWCSGILLSEHQKKQQRRRIKLMMVNFFSKRRRS